MTLNIQFMNCTGESVKRDGQLGAVDWFPESVDAGGTATGQGAADGGWVTYKGAGGSITIHWQVSGDGTVTISATGYPSSCYQSTSDSTSWSIVANPAPAPAPTNVDAAPNCTTVNDHDCLCASCATDRDCMVAIIARYMSPEGTKVAVPGFASDGKNSSCGDTLGWLIHLWGSKENLYFMVPVTDRPGQGSMPSAGDIFVLEENYLRPGETIRRRAHVGFIYRVRGDASNFEWQPAEGGQETIVQGAAGQMWINPGWRGIKGKTTDLMGWKSLDSVKRDRTQCKGKPRR